MKDQHILVTGGTGILGSYIVEALLDSGFTDIEIFTRGGKLNSLSFANDSRVSFTRGDVTELYPLIEVVERADYIIHTSAIVSFHPKKFAQMHAVNVDGTANIVNAALDANVKKLIHISSVAALGRDEKGGVISEKTTWSNSKYNSYYGITKYLAEQEVWRAHHEGLDSVIVNPSVILGEGLWGQSSLQLFKKAYDGIPYYPTGSTAIVDAKDVAMIVVYLLRSEESGERYIAAGGDVSYKDLFQIMAKSMDRQEPRRPAPEWMLGLLWRMEKVRSLLTGSEPIVTQETVMSTSHDSHYDNQKSKDLGWGEYTSVRETIEKYSKSYAEFKAK